MLIFQDYEPLVKFDENRVKLVLNLPEVVMNNSQYIYKRKIKFLKTTYINLKYIGEEGEILEEMVINLNEHINEYLTQLLDFFKEQKLYDIRLLEEALKIDGGTGDAE